jgi:glycine/D-amino acid oxidase-like deaminating enzyme/nitrite reductase/ring-hydroxylating ferredoxin subunit
MDEYGKTPSVWLDTVPETDYPPLSGDISVDVAIVGAGITGLTLATYLKDAGYSVAVIEMRRVGSGVSERTTAHITEIVDGRYQKLIGNFGQTGAQLIAESSSSAIQFIADMVQRKNIDCDFQRVSGYLYTEFDEKVGDIEKEVAAAQKLGIHCELIHDIPLLTFPVKAALRVDNQAQFHPLKYLHALAQDIPNGGSHLFENTHVEKFEDGEPCRVITNKGTITAKNVVLATHTPIGLNMSLQTRVAPYRSYVIGVHLDSQAIPVGLFWDTEDPYNYIRSYGDLVIIGGRDHKTGQDDDTEVHYAEIETYARQRFNVRDIAYRWSGQVYEPVDNAPYIGKNPGDEHIYVATGYAGNGMTYGTIAARLLAALLMNRANRWSEVYDPARIKPLASAKEFVRENVNVGFHMVADRLGKADVDSLTEVAPGQGAIVELEGEKVAVYRDPQGAITLLSPECKHMGCLVQWNTAESTWDCPCHGGRYTATGKVIEGPPTSNLEVRMIDEAHQM